MDPHRLSLATAGIVLLLVVTIPVTGAPALSQGARSLYNLDASFSLVRGPNCTPTPHIICPMIATMVLDVDLHGTVGWQVTAANSTNVDLNVTSDLSLTLLNTTRLPTRTFAESVNLTNRLVSFPPPLPIIDDALSAMVSQVQTALPSGCDPSTMLSAIATLPDPLHHLYTMWWVNGPLTQGERVPILALPPLPVLRQETLDLGSLGTRTAWVIGLESTSITVPLGSTMAVPAGVVNATAQLLFYYDTKSDLLLKSTASLQLGYPVDPSTSLLRTSVGASFTLTLASTSLSLDQPIPPSSTSSSGSGNGTGQGPGSGDNGSGSNSQSTSSSSQSSGPTGSQPNINPGGSIIQSSNLKSPGLWPWVYLVSGLVVAVIASFGAWTVRRRREAKPFPSTQAPSA